MSKERYESEYGWIIDNNKRKTKESIIVYDEEWDTLDDICELLNRQDKTIADLESKLAESEKKHLLDETEWQDYCAFKHIEPQIKGCLDREREYEKQLAEKDDALETHKRAIQRINRNCDTTMCRNKISFAVEQLEKVKELVEEKSMTQSPFGTQKIYASDVSAIIDNQIKVIKGK